MGNNSPFKPHFHESYMIDIVPVLFAGEILSTKVLENHRYGNTVFTRQYYFAVLSDFVCHNKLLLSVINCFCCIFRFFFFPYFCFAGLLFSFLRLKWDKAEA